MNKTKKIGVLIIIFSLIAVIAYFWVGKKSNFFSPVSKLPTNITFQEGGDGCNNIFVYKINSNDTAGISVFAVKDELNLSTTKKHLRLGKPTA